jgi:hypothetical protein
MEKICEFGRENNKNTATVYITTTETITTTTTI